MLILEWSWTYYSLGVTHVEDYLEIQAMVASEIER